METVSLWWSRHSHGDFLHIFSMTSSYLMLLTIHLPNSAAFISITTTNNNSNNDTVAVLALCIKINCHYNLPFQAAHPDGIKRNWQIWIITMLKHNKLSMDHLHDCLYALFYDRKLRLRSNWWTNPPMVRKAQLITWSSWAEGCACKCYLPLIEKGNHTNFNPLQQKMTPAQRQ